MLITLTLIISFTMPVNYVDGSPLPDEPLAALLVDVDTGEILTGEIRLPGTNVRIWVRVNQGCFEVFARLIESRLESESAGPVCKGQQYKCGDGCHQ